MGRTLGLIADRVEASAHRATVEVTEVLSPGLRRLVLRSPEFHDVSTDPCDVTAFRVSRVDFRHYTPALLDTTLGDLEVVVVRHGDHTSGPTPGHDLVESWVVGDEVRASRWSSTRAFHWDPADPRPVLLLGDATVISLAMAMQRRAAQEQRDLTVVLEVPPLDAAAARALVPGATVLAAAQEPGLAVDAWLRDHVAALAAADHLVAYLAGHGQSIQRQRTLLRESVGLDRRAVRTQPYWATGRAGL